MTEMPRKTISLPPELENAVYDVDEMVKELYDFLGLRYTPSTVDFFSEENYSAEVLYTRQQLRHLCNLVLEVVFHFAVNIYSYHK